MCCDKCARTAGAVWPSYATPMPRWIDGFEPETLGLTISVGQSVRNSARFAQGLRKPAAHCLSRNDFRVDRPQKHRRGAGAAAFRGVSEHEFIQQFTRLRPDRRGLALMHKPNGECVFLDGKNCAVQPVKPQQCRDFPNLWNFPGFEQACRALPNLVSEEEYRRLVVAATGRPLTPV